MGFKDIEKDLKEARKKRGIIKAALTRMKRFVEQFDPTTEAISLLEFRQEELPRLNQKFDEIQTQIELIIPEECEKEYEERDKFENDYFSIRSQIQEIVNAKKLINSSTHNSTLNMSTHQQRAQLPPIDIPKFSGNIQDWESFFDCFRALVHDDNSLTAAQKFYYLRSSITGAAIDLIKTVPMTDTNYDVAIERLKQRYDNRGLVIQSHIRSLIESPYVENPSSSALQTLHSHVCTHVAALKALDKPTEQWDAWLVTIVVSRLDAATCHGWQLRQHNTQLPKYIDLEKFLESRCVAFETSEAWSNPVAESKNAASTLKRSNHHNGTKKVSLTAMDVGNDKCICCDQSHKLYACDKFKKLSVNDRLQLAREARLCFNCLSPFHTANYCKSKWTCPRCKKKHNSLLHFEVLKGEENKTNDKAGETSPQRSDNSEISLPISLTVRKSTDYVFLATAVVLITSSNGVQHKCRAILDSGSQVNFISRGLLNSLQITAKKTNLHVRGVGACNVQVAAVAEVHINSRVKQYDTKLLCYVIPTVVNGLASCAVPKGGWSIPNEYLANLADPTFYKTDSVDLLIGGGIFYELLESDRIQLDVGSLCLQGTKFGYVVTGEIGVTCLLSTSSVGEEIEQDWVAVQSNTEKEYGRQSRGNQKCREAQMAMEHFMATYKRNAEGRFILRLPVKSNEFDLGDTLSMAKCRFLNIERKLQRDEELRTEYVKFMDDYLKMGHMQEVVESEIPQRVYYLPHHAVVKTASLTTKVRVVFDASAKGSKGQSLNDILLCGPTIQEDVFTILCRFRKHLYVIIADIEKMYRQVAVAQEDRDLQRIVWRSTPSEELRTYQLNTVTYGTASASFMATQCLTILAEQFAERYSRASKAVKGDFYMDDLMTGSDTEEE